MSYEQRWYQSLWETGVQEAWRDLGVRSVLVQSPTGSGKSSTASDWLGRAAARGMRCWYLVHRRELMTQASRTFSGLGVPHGIIGGGFTPNKHELVQVGSVQSVVRKLDTLEEPKLIMFEEAHHVPSNTQSEIYRAFPKAFKIGWTATPCRLDGRGLSDYFEHLVLGPPVAKLIEQGFLSPYRYYAPTRPDLTGVHTRAGDYAVNELEPAMNQSRITGDAIAEYRRYADGKRALVFCVSIKHSQAVAAQFAAAGYAAKHIDGTMPAVERDAAFRAFAAGTIQVLSQVDLAGEGVDIPAIEAAILLRPTQSLTVYLQAVGRSLRPMSGKTAVLLDHAGCVFRHGLPDDDRVWTLEGTKKRTKRDDESSTAIKQCPACFNMCRAALRECPACGESFEVRSREIEHVAGDLAEVDPDALRRMRRREEGRAQTLDELRLLAAQRGYARGWAEIRWKARQRKMGARA